MFYAFVSMLDTATDGTGNVANPSNAGLNIGDPGLWGQLGGFNGLIIFAFFIAFAIFLKTAFDFVRKDAESKNEAIKMAIDTSAAERAQWLSEANKTHEQHAQALKTIVSETVDAMREHTAAINALRTELITNRNQRS